MEIEEPDHEMPMTPPISYDRIKNEVNNINNFIINVMVSINNKDIGILTDFDMCIIPDYPEVIFTRILQMEDNYIGIIEKLITEDVIQPKEHFNIKVKLWNEECEKEYNFKKCRMWDWRIKMHNDECRLSCETCSFQAEELEIN